MLLVRDDARHAPANFVRALHGLLQQRQVTDQIEQMLGLGLAGKWPQPCPETTGKNDRIDATLTRFTHALNSPRASPALNNAWQAFNGEPQLTQPTPTREQQESARNVRQTL
jgi:hypothetical protein